MYLWRGRGFWCWRNVFRVRILYYFVFHLTGCFVFPYQDLFFEKLAFFIWFIYDFFHRNTCEKLTFLHEKRFFPSVEKKLKCFFILSPDNSDQANTNNNDDNHVFLLEQRRHQQYYQGDHQSSWSLYFGRR